MWTNGPNPSPVELEMCFKTPSTWFWCKLKFENHHSNEALCTFFVFFFKLAHLSLQQGVIWLPPFHLCPGRYAVKCAVPSNKPSLSNWVRPRFVDLFAHWLKLLQSIWHRLKFLPNLTVGSDIVNKGLQLSHFPEPVDCVQNAFVCGKRTSYSSTQGASSKGHLYLSNEYMEWTF